MSHSEKDQSYMGPEYSSRLDEGSQAANKRLDTPGDVHTEQVIISSLGSRLKKRREQTSYPLDQLAKTLGVTPEDMLLAELGFVLEPDDFFNILDRWAQILHLDVQTELRDIDKDIAGYYEHMRKRPPRE